MNSNRDHPLHPSSKFTNLPLPSQLLDYFEHPIASSLVQPSKKASRLSKPISQILSPPLASSQERNSIGPMSRKQLVKQVIHQHLTLNSHRQQLQLPNNGEDTFMSKRNLDNSQVQSHMRTDIQRNISRKDNVNQTLSQRKLQPQQQYPSLNRSRSKRSVEALLLRQGVQSQNQSINASIMVVDQPNTHRFKQNQKQHNTSVVMTTQLSHRQTQPQKLMNEGRSVSNPKRRLNNKQLASFLSTRSTPNGDQQLPVQFKHIKQTVFGGRQNPNSTHFNQEQHDTQDQEAQVSNKRRNIHQQIISTSNQKVKNFMKLRQGSRDKLLILPHKLPTYNLQSSSKPVTSRAHTEFRSQPEGSHLSTHEQHPLLTFETSIHIYQGDSNRRNIMNSQKQYNNEIRTTQSIALLQSQISSNKGSSGMQDKVAMDNDVGSMTFYKESSVPVSVQQSPKQRSSGLSMNQIYEVLKVKKGEPIMLMPCVKVYEYPFPINMATHKITQAWADLPSPHLEFFNFNCKYV